MTSSRFSWSDNRVRKKDKIAKKVTLEPLLCSSGSFNKISFFLMALFVEIDLCKEKRADPQPRGEAARSSVNRTNHLPPRNARVLR